MTHKVHDLVFKHRDLPSPPPVKRQPREGCKHFWLCDQPRDGYVRQECQKGNCRGEKYTVADPFRDYEVNL